MGLYGVWSNGIWCMDYEVWVSLEYGVRSNTELVCMEYGSIEYGLVWRNWNMEYGLVWTMEYGLIWKMDYGVIEY